MCCLPFSNRTFDWVLNFFTSFGYFETEKENFEVISEIARILTPNGRFLIDLFNRDHVLSNLVPREQQNRDGYDVEIERWFDPRTQRVNKKMRVFAPDREAQTFVESVRAYRREEVEIGLQWAGLEVDELYGNFQGERYHRDSERLILVGNNPG